MSLLIIRGIKSFRLSTGNDSMTTSPRGTHGNSSTLLCVDLTGFHSTQFPYLLGSMTTVPECFCTTANECCRCGIEAAIPSALLSPDLIRHRICGYCADDDPDLWTQVHDPPEPPGFFYCVCNDESVEMQNGRLVWIDCDGHPTNAPVGDFIPLVYFGYDVIRWFTCCSCHSPIEIVFGDPARREMIGIILRRLDDQRTVLGRFLLAAPYLPPARVPEEGSGPASLEMEQAWMVWNWKMMGIL